MADVGPQGGEGRLGWLLTFAVLTLLLLGLLVLLLSTASLDAARFREMAWAMQDALGVPRKPPLNEPGQRVGVGGPESPPAEQAGDRSRQEIQVRQAEPKPAQTEGPRQEKAAEEQQVLKPQMDEARQRLLREVRQDARDLSELVKDQIAEGLVSVEPQEDQILLRIQEQALFLPARADIEQGFLEVIDRISAAFATMPGQIRVVGHGDTAPLTNSPFRSQWELSALRAVAVVHEMVRNGDIDPQRILVEGRASSAPLVSNDTAAHRTQNRRLEIVISRGESKPPRGERPLPPGSR
jgi:chemotaxis protein MotB